jgi:hypothetical protein
MAGNSKYKAWHKPSAKARTLQGYYKVQNKQKYVGDPSLVVYRSSWEMKFCRWCDYSPSILRWSSEPLSIPYYDRISNLEKNKKERLDNNNPRNWKIRNYHTDFWCEVQKGDEIEKWFVEIKPEYELRKPVPPPINSPLKKIKRFNTMAKNYLINESKFASLNEWAKKHDMKFYVFTEKTLAKILGGMFK